MRKKIKLIFGLPLAFAVAGLRSPRQITLVLCELFTRNRESAPEVVGNEWEDVPSQRLALLIAGIGISLLAVFLAVHPFPGVSGRNHSQPQRAGVTEVAVPSAQTSQALTEAATSAASEPAADRWQTYTVQRGDTLSALFARAGLDQAECARVMALGKAVATLRTLHPGEQLRLRCDSAQGLIALRYAPDDLHTLEVTSGAKGLQAHLDKLQPVTERTTISAEINDTLNRALRRAGLSAAMVAEFVRIFHWRVDFRREVRRGTRVSLVYNKRWVKNHELSPGPIMAAELVLHDRTLRAFRFAAAPGEVGYYDDHGASMHPSLLRTPVHYTRISSPFSLHRFDPVVRVWRPHYGVDLAAHLGTPVVAAGDGRISFIGRNGGYGNLVTIKNFGPYSTRYAHLRRFARHLHRGSYVSQGEVIGYVGQSGEATGPHLHFEIRVNGVPHDPLRVKLPAGPPLNRHARSRFKDTIRPLLTLLDSGDQGPSQLASAEAGATAKVRSL